MPSNTGPHKTLRSVTGYHRRVLIKNKVRQTNLISEGENGFKENIEKADEHLNCLGKG